MFIASIILFEVGSAICGAAPSMNALIVGRAIAGIGGSGIFLGYVCFIKQIANTGLTHFASTLNYFSLCMTDRERGHYIAGIGVVWGMGAVLGPVVGGAFSTSSAAWRWAFYINR